MKSLIQVRLLIDFEWWFWKAIRVPILQVALRKRSTICKIGTFTSSKFFSLDCYSRSFKHNDRNVIWLQIQLPKLIPLQQQPHIIQPQMVMQQQPQMLQQPRKLILQAQIVPQHQQEVQVQALQEVQPHQQVEPQPQRHDEVVFSFI